MADNENISFLQRSKIQSETLVPVVAAFEKEIGKERSHAIVSKALRDSTRNFYENIRNGFESNPIDLIAGGLSMFAEDGALDYEILNQTEGSFDLNITRCSYAEFYKELGRPDFGYICLCDLDFTIAECLGSDIEFKRTQTIMEGAPHCDYRYRIKK
ncbi:MAG: L-2-amino-thiazoline-4-carboxylic acid hydrolase [Desulfobacterales bacterium]